MTVNERVTVFRQKASVHRCPTAARIQPWVQAALDEAGQHPEPVALTIRFVDYQEGASLNQQYRHKNYATNVLSFPYEAPVLPQIKNKRAMVAEEPSYLGDLVICMPIILSESLAQKKLHLTHTAHMVVHGVLHLLGYDHQSDEEAERMEQIEVNTLQKLGFENPYLAD